MANKVNGQTTIFSSPPGILSCSSVVGPEEGNGPLGNKFDLKYNNAHCGKKTWEKGEMQMVKDAIDLAIEKAALELNNINFILGGDLLNQIIISNFVARDYSRPFLGLYGACSTMIEALALGSIFVDGSYADNVLCFSSSHYQTAERQFRTPLEYGDQYPPCKQWTITGAGSYILSNSGGKVVITHSTIGKIVDLAVKNSNNLGAAMAPAAADTIMTHFMDLNRGPQDYDLIITGDLGRTGKGILDHLLRENNIDLGNKLQDCGDIVLKNQKKYGSGGSGCAATAITLAALFIPEMIANNLKRILIMGTGSLMNPMTIQQNESIPAIAHAIVVERSQNG